MMTVRTARISDADALGRLNAEVQLMHAIARPSRFKPPSSEAFAPSLLATLLADRDVYLFVSEDDGRTVGYVYARIVRRPEDVFVYAVDMLVVEQVAVSATHRRRGHGERLVRHVLDLARRQGITRAELTVWSFNAAARAFYERLGFSVTTERMARDDL